MVIKSPYRNGKIQRFITYQADDAQGERITLKKCFEVFCTLITKIIIWFKFIIFNFKDPDEKEKLWKNTAGHLTAHFCDILRSNSHRFARESKNVPTNEIIEGYIPRY